MLSSSPSTNMFIVGGILLLVLVQLTSVSAVTCPSVPTITLAQYMNVTAGTTVTKMKAIMGGLGYLQSVEYADPMSATISSLAYTYQGTNQVPTSAGLAGQTSSYAIFTFHLSTQQLNYKMQYGLC